jgi:hypothetical protein
MPTVGVQQWRNHLSHDAVDGTAQASGFRPVWIRRVIPVPHPPTEAVPKFRGVRPGVLVSISMQKFPVVSVQKFPVDQSVFACF